LLTNQSLPGFKTTPVEWLPLVVWVAAAAVVIKFWLAAFSWQKIHVKYLRQYLPVWLGGNACLIALSFLLEVSLVISCRRIPIA
jgi:hypothetical protein